MQKRNYSMLAAAAIAASIPLVSKAATLSYTFDPNILISTDGGNSFHAATVTTSGSNYTVHIASGNFLEVSIDGSVTGNANAAPTGGSSYQASNPTLVPANLGFDSFQVGFTDSNKAVAGVEDAGYWNGTAPIGSTTTTAIANADFTSGSNAGTIDGSGGVTSNTGIFGGAPASSTTASQLAYGAGSTPVNLASDIYIGGFPDGAASANGTAVFTLSAVAANQSYYTYKSGGTSSKSAPSYQATVPTGADTLNFGTLTVIVGSTGPTAQPIISLVSSSSTPGATYGQADGTITMTGKGYGSYNVSTAAGFTAATTGGIDVKGFNPTSDTEVYALKLTSNGVAISGTQITTVIADINGANGNTAAVGVTASAVTGVYTNLFPGYEVLLTSTAGITDDAELNFDFSSTGEQDSAVPGLVLTGVAAVPEPATAAGVILGAAGLLLGRRRNRLMLV